ncbi:MAG: tetratricopeptide repeat protein [Proteobacteria bacterium]|nr:tetratricopeptide repeat protein [Pseudomonadota bacterium]MBU1714600.1 tetratricopeptide repeat protein [Pseudomonadota bacterium]
MILRKLIVLLILPVAFFSVLSPGMVATATAAEEGKVVIESPTKLWAEAVAAVEAEQNQRAAYLFERLFEYYPDHEKAEEALWRAAEILKAEALVAKKPEWEKVRDLYRKFFGIFPKSKHAPDAYLEVGIAHFHMSFLREALIYFKLFLERYPKSENYSLGLFWKAKTLVAIGQSEEAEKIYHGLIAGKDKKLRHQAAVALGDLNYAAGKYKEALRFFNLTKKELAPESKDYADLLGRIRSALVRHDSEAEIQEGRKLLYHYINVLADSPQERAKGLFELAESYYRQGEDATAQIFYEKILDESPQSDLAVLIRFRQAQYLDDPRSKLGKWQKRNDLTDPAGDAPYKELLAAYSAGEISQDARYGLMLRYQSRGDFEKSYELGRDYLKRGGGRFSKKVESALGQILVAWVEKHLENKEYDKIFDLYRAEHEHVADYGGGRLLSLIGQAMEALALYDQAAVVYYRALGLALTDQERLDLYFRRAMVYLAKKDLASADLLLTHLRDIYQGSPALAEIYFLSGRLREDQGEYAPALDFYKEAISLATRVEKKSEYAGAHLQLLLARQQLAEASEAIEIYRQNKWLAGPVQQEMYRLIGDARLAKNELWPAADAYLLAVADYLPQETALAQEIHMRLGEIYLQLGKKEKSNLHFGKASKGEDPLWRKVAQERYKQNEIDQAVSEVRAVLN